MEFSRVLLPFHPVPAREISDCVLERNFLVQELQLISDWWRHKMPWCVCPLPLGSYQGTPCKWMVYTALMALTKSNIWMFLIWLQRLGYPCVVWFCGRATETRHILASEGNLPSATVQSSFQVLTWWKLLVNSSNFSTTLTVLMLKFHCVCIDLGCCLLPPSSRMSFLFMV